MGYQELNEAMSRRPCRSIRPCLSIEQRQHSHLQLRNQFHLAGLKALKLSLSLLAIKNTFNDRFSMSKIL